MPESDIGEDQHDGAKLVAALRQEAQALGFSALGVAPATLPDSVVAGLDGFLEAGHQGEMGWMAEHRARRSQPKALWPEVRSVIALAMTYGPKGDPLANLSQPMTANISVYARARDYHEVVKPKLKQLARWLLARAGGDVKVFVDTAPVMEKPLAALAGLGWQGKHTNLLSRDLGNWFFLGFVFTTLDLPKDRPADDHCGQCRACLDTCPTDAFLAPNRLDARRCISYLTIEHKGPIPRALRAAIGNRIYGCDDCLAICPWNKFAQQAQETKLQAKAELIAPSLTDLAQLDDAAFRRLFSGSAVKRIGHAGFLRNLLIALGNSGQAEALPLAKAQLDNPDPLVRSTAVWAFSRLDRDAFETDRETASKQEEHPWVLAEWREEENLA
ncbi:MAG: tRNA epoxyqueuosine(34) reductase QueG [Kiloniellales bacterium]